MRLRRTPYRRSTSRRRRNRGGPALAWLGHDDSVVAALAVPERVLGRDQLRDGRVEDLPLRSARLLRTPEARVDRSQEAPAVVPEREDAKVLLDRGQDSG